MAQAMNALSVLRGAAAEVRFLLDPWVTQLVYASDVVLCLTYLAIAVRLVHVTRRRREMSQTILLHLFAAYLLVCGVAFAVEKSLFPLWSPQSAVVKLCLATMSFILCVVLLSRVSGMSSSRAPEALQREVTQRRRTELELRKIHAQLEGVIELRTSELAAKNEEMEQFLNTVSHDLKNPVVTSLGLAGILREDVKSGRVDDSIDSIARIERSMTRMKHLIDDLLNLSRIGRIRFEIADIDVSSMLDGIRDELQLRLEQSGVELKIEGDLPHVNGDARWLGEVFENLISNALKYGCDNPHPRIVVGGRMVNGEALFFIRDNGRGIDKAHHAQIFEPFRRLPSDKEGSGMGLAIVARITKMHSGRVWVESEPGMGATFWIALPAKDHERSAQVELAPALA